jgi:hypothetical protein
MLRFAHLWLYCYSELKLCAHIRSAHIVCSLCIRYAHYIVNCTFTLFTPIVYTLRSLCSLIVYTIVLLFARSLTMSMYSLHSYCTCVVRSLSILVHVLRTCTCLSRHFVPRLYLSVSSLRSSSVLD